MRSKRLFLPRDFEGPFFLYNVKSNKVILEEVEVNSIFFWETAKKVSNFPKNFQKWLYCSHLTTKNTSKRLLIVGEIFQIKKNYRFWCCFCCCFLLRSFWPTKTWGQKSNFWLSKQHVEWGLRRAFFFFLLRCSWTTKNWGQKAKFCWSKQQSERRLRQTMLFALLRGNTNKGTKGNLLPN